MIGLIFSLIFGIILCFFPQRLFLALDLENEYKKSNTIKKIVKLFGIMCLIMFLIQLIRFLCIL